MSWILPFLSPLISFLCISAAAILGGASAYRGPRRPWVSKAVVFLPVAGLAVLFLGPRPSAPVAVALVEYLGLAGVGLGFWLKGRASQVAMVGGWLAMMGAGLWDIWVGDSAHEAVKNTLLGLAFGAFTLAVYALAGWYERRREGVETRLPLGGDA